jgi:hypothetical protein
MLLKWIVCDVADDDRAAFSRAQASWAALRTVEGFLGQAGGWNLAVPGQACIVGLWADVGAYERFMRDAHDRIVESSDQGRTYRAIRVLLVDVLVDIAGSGRALGTVLGDGGLLRVADCVLNPGRAAQFIEMQTSVWNPAMAAAGGMLAGAFGCVRRETDHYLVCTLWENAGVHQAYVDQALPVLQARAEIGLDLRRITGHIVTVEPSWRVPAGGHESRGCQR